MKFFPLVLLIFISFCVKVSGQTKNNGFAKCDFLKDVVYKNTTDTITVKVIFDGMILNPEWPELKKLEQEKKLKASDYKYVIAFKLDNCSTKYAVPSSDLSKEALSLYKEQYSTKILNLTCVVFKGYYNLNKPFFVVNKVHIIQ